MPIKRLLPAVLVAAVLAGASASAVRADAPTPLGGLALTPYCQSLGYDGDTLTKPQLGPSAAYDNWRCFVGTRDAPTSLHPFSMEQACKFQYGHAAIQARPTDPDDAYTWVCYTVAQGIEIPLFCYEPRLTPPVGACHMCLCVVEPGPSRLSASGD
jgi:hypothetical protein